MPEYPFNESEETMQGRYKPLDVFRGFTVAGMILVNNPGSWSHVYPLLGHAHWNGCTFADLVFPFFLFMVGMSIFLAYQKRGFELNRTNTTKILKRTLVIFLLGMGLAAFPFFRGWDYYTRFRFMGVLQRIALAYGGGALLCLSLNRKQLIGLVALILVGYWAMLGYYGPDPFSLEHNLVLTVDKAVFGEAHLWRGTGIPFDPEGLLSTLPSIATVIIGFLVASFLIKSDHPLDVKKMVASGLVLILIGWVWGLAFPINKSIWTSSFVIFTAGFALIVLAVFILAMARWGNDREFFHFFEVYGVNPLAAFVGSGLLAKMMYMIKFTMDDGTRKSISSLLFHSVYEPIMGAGPGSLAFALTHVFFWYLVLRFMYHRKWFLKV
jgi:predicted acyltransferase